MSSRSEPTSLPNSRGGFLETLWPPLRPHTEVRSSLPPERFVQVKGQQIYVEQQGWGEPLVLLHGYACSSFSWRHVMPTLARHFRVVALDLNGFGYTQRLSEPEHYTIDGQLRLIAGTLEALEIESCHLLGHSFGGALSLALAARSPERVRTLTLVCSALPGLHKERRSAWARYRSLCRLVLRSVAISRRAVRRALTRCYCEPELVTDELVDAYRERLLVEGLDDAFFGLKAPVEKAPPEIDFMAIRQPTLVIWGDRDRVLPIEKTRPLLGRIPRALLLTLEGCGHAPMEESPERFLEHALPFLLEHRLGTAAWLLESLRHRLGWVPWASNGSSWNGFGPHPPSATTTTTVSPNPSPGPLT
jgi:pimeloyl-ACP methyl ester carboxylesterase